MTKNNSSTAKKPKKSTKSETRSFWEVDFDLAGKTCFFGRYNTKDLNLANVKALVFGTLRRYPSIGEMRISKRVETTTRVATVKQGGAK